MLRPREERLPFTGDQRINNKPEFIHQPSIDKARRSSSTPNEINVFAGLLLEGSDFLESPDEARVRPESRSQGAREHIMRGARGEAGPFDLSRRRRAVGDPGGLVRLILYPGPISLVAGVHTSSKNAG